jgi:tetratricopeptide (TPR) repeat protein
MLTVYSVLDLFDRLNPRDQLGRLMIVLGMPEQFRPSCILSLSEQQNKIIDWAKGGPGLERLAEALQKLIDDQETSPGVLPSDLKDLPPNLPKRNPYFTGRDAVIESMEQELTSGKTHLFAIYGLGGIGKTQIALEYAYRNRSRYRTVWWLDAEPPEHFDTETRHSTVVLDLSNGLLNLARALDLKPERFAIFNGRTDDDARLLAALMRWLENQRSWLLIFDNADDLKAVEPYLPTNLTGSVVLTSRVQNFQILGPNIVCSEIQSMGEPEAMLFLLRRTQKPGVKHHSQSLEDLLTGLTPAESRAFREIIDKLGGLPLALEQAGAYVLDQNQISFVEYLAAYQANTKRLLGYPPVKGDYTRSVETTWRMNFKEIALSRPRGRAAVAVLRLSAFLAPDNIPFEILSKGTTRISNALRILDLDPTALPEILALLTKYSLIRKEQRAYSIHRLVQQVIQNRMMLKDKARWVEKAILVLNHCFPEPTFDVRASCDRLFPHALMCKNFIDTGKLNTANSEQLLRKLSEYLSMIGQYAEQQDICQSLLRVRTALYSEDSIPVTDSLQDLGRIHKSQGRYEESDTKYTDALKILKKHRKEEPRRLAAVLNNLAVVKSRRRLYRDAESYYRKAGLVQTQFLGASQEDTRAYSNILLNLSVVSQKRDRSERARYYLDRAEKIHGGNPTFEVSLSGAADAYELGTVYEAQGRHADAEKLYEWVLEARQKLLPPHHPDLANTMSVIARVCEKQRKYPKAQGLYERALQALRDAGAQETHPEVMRAKSGLAWLLANQERYEDAQPIFEQLFKTCERAFPGNHVELVQKMHDLAWLYTKRALYESADPLFRRLLEIRIAAFGPGAEETLITLREWAFVSARLDRHDEAAARFGRVLKFRTRTANADVEETLGTVEALAQNCANKKDYQAAEAYFRMLVDTLVSAPIFGEKHLRTVQNKHELAVVLVKQKRYAAAEPLFEQVLAVRDPDENAEDVETINTLYFLAWAYAQRDRHDEAAARFGRVLKFRTRTANADVEETLRTVEVAAQNCANKKDYQAAEAYFRMLVDTLVGAPIFGEKHLRTVQNKHELAVVLVKQKRYAAAEPLFEQVLAVRDPNQNAQDLDTAETLFHLACIYSEEKRYKNAELLYRRALDIQVQTAGPDSEETLETAENLAQLLTAQKRYVELPALLQQALRWQNNDQNDSCKKEQNKT